MDTDADVRGYLIVTAPHEQIYRFHQFADGDAYLTTADGAFALPLTGPGFWTLAGLLRLGAVGASGAPGDGPHRGFLVASAPHEGIVTFAIASDGTEARAATTSRRGIPDWGRARTVRTIAELVALTRPLARRARRTRRRRAA